MGSWMTILVMVLSTAAGGIAQWSLRSDGKRSPAALDPAQTHKLNRLKQKGQRKEDRPTIEPVLASEA
jgi:hypothetical protein